MSRIRRPDTSAKSTVYGPPADTGADDAPTIIRDDYEIGTVGGRNGPTFSVGKVGMEVPSVVFPGKSAGTGVGVRGRMSFKKGGATKKPVKKMAKGGSTASKRADGCAIKGKTKGRMV